MRRALALAGVMLAAAAGVPAAGVPAGGQAGEGAIELKDAPGRDLAEARCAICHSLDYIPANAPVMNRGGWDKTIQKMRKAYGAPITDEEAQQILGYLAAGYSGKP